MSRIGLFAFKDDSLFFTTDHIEYYRRIVFVSVTAFLLVDEAFSLVAFSAQFHLFLMEERRYTQRTSDYTKDLLKEYNSIAAQSAARTVIRTCQRKKTFYRVERLRNDINST